MEVTGLPTVHQIIETPNIDRQTNSTSITNNTINRYWV
jgi:hypothetical protein